MSKEALKLALKMALEVIQAWDRGANVNDYWRDRFDAITAIREALAEQPAQPQQRPDCPHCGGPFDRPCSCDLKPNEEDL